MMLAFNTILVIKTRHDLCDHRDEWKVETIIHVINDGYMCFKIEQSWI